MKKLVLAACFLAVAAPATGQVGDSANTAWIRGDVQAAARLYEQRLAQDSSDISALHRLALAKAWNRQFDESLPLFERLLRMDPGNTEVRLHEANALAWAGRLDDARRQAEAVLREQPGDTAAISALARFSGWAGRYEDSRRYYRQVLRLDPDNVEAAKGLARVAAWSGHLRESERRWREVLAAQPGDVDALVGLAATLRWQGRTSAGLDVLDRAERLAPENADVEAQRRWLLAAAGPSLAPGYLYESDSDGNRAETFRLAGSWLVARRVGLRFTADTRDFTQETGLARESSARRADLVLSLGLGAGWTLSGGGGVRTGDGATQESMGLWQAALSSPTYLPVSASLSASRSAFDYTAQLAQNNVAVEEASLGLSSVLLARRLRLSARGGIARFLAAEDNTRWLANARVSFHPVPVFSVGVNGRGFGFEKDLAEGYWDPTFYGLVEVPLGLSLETDHFFGGAEVAPGYQTVDHPVIQVDHGALRADARIGFRFAPGRQIAISGTVANSGVQRVSPVPDAQYEYRAVNVMLSWSLR